MARKVLWLVTVEKDDLVQGWTEKNHFTASEVIGTMKKAPGSGGAEFRIFRLTLVNGKIYANRIVEKEKGDEIGDSNTAKFNPSSTNFGGTATNTILREGDRLSSPLRVQRPE